MWRGFGRNPRALHQAVYKLFVSQLEHIAKPQAPLFKKYYYLLENLSDVQAFCMCIDLGATDTLETLFKTLFDSITSVILSLLRARLASALMGKRWAVALKDPPPTHTTTTTPPPPPHTHTP